MKYKILILSFGLSTIWTSWLFSQQTDFRNLDKMMDKFEKKGFSGTVLVAKGDDIVYSKSKGEAQRSNSKPISSKTKFPIGSVTKPITATLVMKLIEEGKLSLSNTLIDFLPDVSNDKKNITIHQLLTHSSGLTHALNHDYVLDSKAEYLKKVMESELLFEPGKGYSYSNIGYSLLAIIMQKLTGKIYDELLSGYILRPLNIDNSGYIRAKTSVNDLQIAYGYGKEGLDGNPLEKPWLEDGPGWHLRGNGGLIFSIDDFYKIISAIHSGKLLRKESYDKIIYPHVEEEDYSHYGYGWVITEKKAKKIIRHNGGNPFFYTLVCYVPKDNLYFFMMSNNDTDMVIPFGEILFNEVFK